MQQLLGWYTPFILYKGHTNRCFHINCNLLNTKCGLGVASYPGLLTPVFVACSTNAGEGLIKLSHVPWPGHVEEWHIPGKTASKRVHYRSQTWTIEHWVLDIRQPWRHFYSESCLTAVQKECATPPHVQVRHCTWLSFTRPSPALVLQATNAGVRRRLKFALLVQ